MRNFHQGAWEEKSLVILAGLLVCFFGTAASASAEMDDRYHFKAINVPPAIATHAFGTNEAGRVVGSYFDATGGHGYIVSHGSFAMIDVPGALYTQALGISGAGQIVGTYTDPQGFAHGYLLHDDQFTTIDYPGAISTNANGINQAGQIVGSFYDKTGGPHGYLLSGGNFYRVEVPGAISTSAVGINGARKIVGTYTDSESSAHGYLLSKERFITLDFPGAVSTSAVGINSFGEIVGTFQDASGLRTYIASASATGNNILVVIKKGIGSQFDGPNGPQEFEVVIVTTEAFDAASVDPFSLRFGPQAALESHGRGHYEDVEPDGDLDLVLHFPAQETGIQCGDTKALLTGETMNLEEINGSVSLVGWTCP